MKTRHIPLRAGLLGLAAVSLGWVLPSEAGAATIAWNYSQIQDAIGADSTLDWAGKISTTGTLVSAQNFSGSSGNFGGVNFAASSINFANIDSVFYNSAVAANNLASFATWSGSATTLTLGAATIGQALQVGQTYEIQMIFGDVRAASNGRTVSFDGGVTKTQYAFSSGGGLWPVLSAVGTFTANAATQDINIQVFNSNNSSAGAQLNGFQIRAVPEPSVALLGGLSALMLLRRRRM